MTETLTKIKTIKAVADAILETHKNSVLKLDGIRFDGINYADLYVRDVSYNLHLDGDETYSVLIEECSPTAYEFQEFMVECLKDKLGFDVNVVCEW
jgi:hypothetical protein